MRWGVVDIAKHPGGPWIAKLPQGEIELVAISRHPSKGQPWWQPDGSRYYGESFVVDVPPVVLRGKVYELVIYGPGVAGILDLNVTPPGVGEDTRVVPIGGGQVRPDGRVLLIAAPETATEGKYTDGRAHRTLENRRGVSRPGLFG